MLSRIHSKFLTVACDFIKCVGSNK
uniref:Uncharacterized protein n=1 Tax=Anguilla anguilla TaxID=7936 RepID=A0A0E9PEH9_ANGAN